LNSHALTRTTPSRWRVYRFHHLGTITTGRSERTRTPDRRFWRPLLYQLSYTPAPIKIIFHYNTACKKSYGWMFTYVKNIPIKNYKILLKSATMAMTIQFFLDI
jgi:hypothetical protein